MKKLILSLALMAAAGLAFAQVNVQRNELGSGTPGTQGVEQADFWSNGIYHAPQYMPGYPTAAVIFPRVVEVECKRDVLGGLNCNGYNWTPDMGRAEYLLVKPRIVEPVVPQVITRTIIKEVPVKKKGE